MYCTFQGIGPGEVSSSLNDLQTSLKVINTVTVT